MTDNSISKLKEQSEALLKKINIAVREVNAAQTELVSRSKAVGLLLLEAKKLHPAVKDFETFLKRVDGLHLSRAYDCMRIAGGRATDEEIKKDTRERVKKHRAGKRAPKTAPAPKPAPLQLSVTVTETPEASAERRKTENAATAEDLGKAQALACFKRACDTWLPQLGTADLAAARSHCDYVIKRCAADRRRAA